MHLITSVPAAQIQEQIVEAMQVIPQEQVAERIVEQIVAVPVPQILEQIVDVPVPQIMEETVEVAKLIPQERVQQRTLEETVNVPVPQIEEPIVAVVKALLGRSRAAGLGRCAVPSRGENGRPPPESTAQGCRALRSAARTTLLQVWRVETHSQDTRQFQ